MSEFLKSVGPLLGVVLGVVLGFILGLVAPYLQRKHRLGAHWAALGVEVEICERLARTYLSAGVAAPLYRLPTMAFSVSLPSLLADGAVSGQEVNHLESFWMWVQDINRGLDNANHAMHAANSTQLNLEVARLRLKCEELLVESSGGNEAYAASAHRVIRAHVA